MIVRRMMLDGERDDDSDEKSKKEMNVDYDEGNENVV
jgi:hypothetical protein